MRILAAAGKRLARERSPCMRDLPPNMTDYLETRASFRLEVPEVYNYARDVVDAWAAREPGKLALLAVGPDGEQGELAGFPGGPGVDHVARVVVDLGHLQPERGPGLQVVGHVGGQVTHARTPLPSQPLTCCSQDPHSELAWSSSAFSSARIRLQPGHVSMRLVRATS